MCKNVAKISQFFNVLVDEKGLINHLRICQVFMVSDWCQGALMTK